MPDTRIVTASVKENVAYMNQILPVKDSFDLVQRDLVIGEREASFFFIDGFMKDEVMLKIMDSFLSVAKEDMPGSATGFARQCLPYVEVDTISGAVVEAARRLGMDVPYHEMAVELVHSMDTL